MAENREIESLLTEIDAKKKELDDLRQDFHQIWKEGSTGIEGRLKKSGGAFAQIRIAASSPAKGKQVKDLTLPASSPGADHPRKGLIIPHGETEIQEGDRVTLLGTPQMWKRRKSTCRPRVIFRSPTIS